MISLGDIQTEQQNGETVIPDSEEDKLLDKLADKVADRIGDSGVEIRSDDENPGLTDVWMAGIPMGKLLDKALQNSRATGSSGHNPKGSDGENGSQSGDLLPIERLIEAENREDATMGYVTESVDRAATLFENFGEWSKVTPKGRTITSDLKNLLSAATGERLSWRQVYRAMDKIEEWSKGTIVHKKTRRHGHILISERSSSVAIG